MAYKAENDQENIFVVILPTPAVTQYPLLGETSEVT